MSNWAASAIKHHREQADKLQAEIDRLSDPAWLAREIAAKSKRRDQWIRLADELARYGDRGFWDSDESHGTGHESAEQTAAVREGHEDAEGAK